MNNLLYFEKYISYNFASSNQYTTVMVQTVIELVEETYNYYGVKADVSLATEYSKTTAHLTPGAFYEWLRSTRKIKDIISSSH